MTGPLPEESTGYRGTPEPADPAPVTGEDQVPGPWSSTGQPAVDAALHALAQVRDAPPAEQLPTFQAAHRTLRETLATIDEQ